MSPFWTGWARLVPIVALSSLFLASCAVTLPTVTQSPNTATLNLLINFPPSLDPTQTDGGDATMIMDSVFSGLMKYTADGTLVPDLAQSYTISPDRTTYTFTLRSDARFQNGDPVTGSSIVFAINRAFAPATRVPVASAYLGDIQGVSARLAGKADSVSGVTAPTPSTVQFRLTHPDDAFLAKLTFPITYALDQSTVTAGGATWWQNPNGSGPYRLTQWNPQSQAVLQRFSSYYGPTPDVATIVLHNPGTVSNPAQVFADGQLDVLPLDPTAQDIEDFINPQSGVPTAIQQNLHTFDVPALQYLVFDQQNPPFNTLAARQAVNDAFDKQALVLSSLGGDGWPANGILPPSMPGYDKSFDPYPYNLQLAHSLLAQSHVPGNGEAITLASSDQLANGQPGPVTSAIAAMLQSAFGWQITLDYVPSGQLNSDLALGHPPADLSLTGWQADYLDPSDFLDLLFHSRLPTNTTGYANPQVDQLLDLAEQTPNAQQRMALYSQVETMIMRDAPIVPLYFDREFALVHPRVVSLQLLPDGSFDLRDAQVDPSIAIQLPPPAQTPAPGSNG